ncbi:MFS transporter [Jatrophihabitans sp.]|uniref:MFS transporter n=1 Tax=Jatrophihabitans sp. TaxID=1932789 RepID=UPI002EF58B19
MSTVAGAPASLWRDPRFRSFWAGQTVSQFGDRVSELALPLIAVATLRASAFQVSLLTALVWIPNLVGVFLGSWIDQRTRKRRLMVWADLLRAGVLTSLPVALLLGGVSLGQLYAVALITGAGGVLFNTAYSAFFAHLVPRSSYVEANSKLSTTRSASYVAGPALGGALVQAFTAPVAVVVDALSFLGSALLLGRIPLTEPAVVAAPSASVSQRAREGMGYVLRHPVLRAALGCATTINFFTFLSSGLLVLFASRMLGLTAGVIGLAFGIGSIGALLGAVIAPRVSALIGVGRSITIGAVLFPAPIAIAAAAEGPLWVRAAALAGAELLSGIGVMLFDVNLNALMTSVVSDGLRGRVAGAFSTVNYGIRPIGSIAGGLLGTLIGLRATLLIAAAGGALSVLWLTGSAIPAIRTLSATHDE